jgi:acyl-CoA synthetase (NDP forming)
VTSYPSVASLPEIPDLAVVAVPATAVLTEIEACAARGVRSAVIYSSGFAETGPDGVELQARIAAVATAGDMRVLGPNCLGFFNVRRKTYATFSTVFSHGWPKPGGLGIVSQSGAIGVHLFSLARDRGLGFSLMIATGNECNVGFGESLAFLAEDTNTRTIIGYLEGCRDPHLMLQGLERARRSCKPVIVLKVGNTQEGAAAAMSHTGALVGANEVFDAAFAEYGAHRAESFEEALDVAEACETRIFPKSNRIGIATVSGGAGILMADAAVAHGLEVPPLSDNTQQQLKTLAPLAAVRNPIDTTAAVLTEMSLLRRFLDTILKEPYIDTAAFFLSMVGRSPDLRPKLMQALEGIREAHADKPIVLSMSTTEELRRDLVAAGFLLVEDPMRAVRTISALVRFGESFRTPPRRARGEIAPLRFDENLRGEHAALRALGAAGLPVVPMRLVTSGTEAATAAGELGFPVVLKIASADIAHKSEIGGVMLGVDTYEAASRGHDELLVRARARMPGARIDGVVVSPMVMGGVETILGAKIDPTFGPVVMFGLGGVFVEIYQDVAFRLAPIDTEAALEMIKEIRGYQILAGARGRPPTDLTTIATALALLSRIIASQSERIASIDINPFIALPSGGAAVDALIVERPADQ